MGLEFGSILFRVTLLLLTTLMSSVWQIVNEVKHHVLGQLTPTMTCVDLDGRNYYL